MLKVSSFHIMYPVGIYLLKVNNRNTWTRCEICSKLTIKTPERRQWLTPLLTLTMYFVVCIQNAERLTWSSVTFGRSSLKFLCVCVCIARVSDFNGTRTHNHLVFKRTLNHLAKRQWHLLVFLLLIFNIFHTFV